MATVLAVDLGKTSCRMAAWSTDLTAPLAESTGHGAPGLAEAGGVTAAEASIVRTFGDFSAVPPPTMVGVGVPGVSAAPTAARELADRLRNVWPNAEIVVAGDAATSHAGALAGGPGVVLAVGTGMAVVAVSQGGDVFHVDGWGPWLGDDGSGAWIGRAGLHAALASYDGRGPATALSEAAREAFGPLDRLPSAIGGDDHPVRAMATFAPVVADHAGSGDEVAGTIIDSAATMLASAVLTGVRKLGTGRVDVALTGGLLKLGDRLTKPLVEHLRLEVDLVPAQGNSLDGARLLAERSDTLHEAALIRVAP
ncbi:hypothetical protein GCM10007304_04580 [Rhodococcoides trifolii]|uniref:ATPase BadF/BadG/BcrA/BcrD type domain-containing protein n=1 Tax=Rhodococcoides trifolii TaxID=908250 RepID=A0A917CMS7_9NOCA|nr:BadF/BadG/BcrA/BcrD ATPase family protein [Rhodococcus trifolii]GGF93870.1 hypothetical protein GCM10007304_04580 [Rhodococcus trifolii]